MEIQDNSAVALNIGVDARTYLAETAKWGKFLSILGFIGCGLMVVFGLFAGSIFATLGNFGGRGLGGRELGAGFGVLFAVIYIALAALYFFPCLFLYRYSTYMQGALRRNDMPALDTSFQNLKSLFKFMGIMMIIALAFYALALIIGLGVGSMTNFN